MENFDPAKYPEGVKQPRIPFPYVDFLAKSIIVTDQARGETKEVFTLRRLRADSIWSNPAQLTQYVQKDGWRVLGYANLNPADAGQMELKRACDVLLGVFKAGQQSVTAMAAKVAEAKAKVDKEAGK